MSLFILATLAAFFIKGLCGFANTLVFQSILSFGVSNASISPVELALGFPGNAILTWQNRKSLEPKVFLPLTALMLAGNIPGALMLSHIDGRIVKIIFGTAIIFIALDMMRGQGKPQKESKWMTALVGVAAGVLSGLFGVGALLAAYVSRITETIGAFKANISVVFLAENVFRFALYVALGILDRAALVLAVKLMPFMLVGLFAGIAVSQKIDDQQIKKLVLCLLVVSGAVLIAQNI